MTSILKQENGELFIYRNRLGLPDRSDEYYNEYGFDEELYNEDCQLWFSSSERIKVAEGEDGKFDWHILRQIGLEGGSNVNTEKVKGFEIPENKYEIKSNCCGRCDGVNDECDAEDRAYFKDDRASEKEAKKPFFCEMDFTFDGREMKCKSQCDNCNVLASFVDETDLPPERPHESSLDPKEHAVDKENIILIIKDRIEREYRKHKDLDWAQIAARKIYSTFKILRNG